MADLFLATNEAEDLVAFIDFVEISRVAGMWWEYQTEIKSAPWGGEA